MRKRDTFPRSVTLREVGCGLSASAQRGSPRKPASPPTLGPPGTATAATSRPGRTRPNRRSRSRGRLGEGEPYAFVHAPLPRGRPCHHSPPGREQGGQEQEASTPPLIESNPTRRQGRAFGPLVVPDRNADMPRTHRDIDIQPSRTRVQIRVRDHLAHTQACGVDERVMPRDRQKRGDQVPSDLRSEFGVRYDELVRRSFPCGFGRGALTGDLTTRPGTSTCRTSAPSTGAARAPSTPHRSAAGRRAELPRSGSESSSPATVTPAH